ncbi:MAG TPA: FtsX-like permease family protein, partial [Bryobacteraceae bacterium]|nr:FtsX-like permease family protein [Bryobacteraceae bacterium]
MNTTAFKIAIREARASGGKFVFVIIAVALGVGALTGVRGFSSAFSNVLLKEARSLMAADLSVRTFAEPSPEQQSALDALAKRQAIHTRVTETATVIGTGREGEIPVLVSLKAVDPRVFPFYGVLTLEPQGSLRERLDASSAVISEDLRVRLGVKVGESLRIGNEAFRIAGIVLAEPDRMSGSFNVGPRVMISRDAMSRTGLIALGSRASQRFLFKLNSGAPNIGTVHDELRRAFPEGMIVDFRELNPNIARGLDRATTFLSLVSLIALIVGAIGVGTSMHAHLQQKMDSIAVMKSIGGRSNQVIRIYVIQTLLLGVAGGLVGVLIGLVVQGLFPFFLRNYFQIQPDLVFSPLPALQGLLIGLLTTLLFTLPPLLSIRRISPALIFRRDMPEVRSPWPVRLRSALPSIAAGVLICLALAGIAGWLTGGPASQAASLGFTFIGGLLASLLILWGVSILLLRILRRVVQRNQKLPITLRHALSNLYRPGSQAGAVLTALGIGVMFTLTVYLVQRSVIGEIARSAPPGMPNVFFLDISAQQRAPLESLIRGHKGASSVEVMPTVSSRLTAVDGVSLEARERTRSARRYRMGRAVTSFDTLPEQAEIVQGKWWSGTPVEPQISITPGAARALQIGPGSKLKWTAFGRTFETRVVAVHRATSNNLRAMVEFIVSPGVLDGLPTVYYAA